jgi:uncharacterized membrane protein YhaH (DUF805 family)
VKVEEYIVGLFFTLLALALQAKKWEKCYLDFWQAFVVHTAVTLLSVFPQNYQLVRWKFLLCCEESISQRNTIGIQERNNYDRYWDLKNRRTASRST